MRAITAFLGCLILPLPGGTVLANDRFDMDFERQDVVSLNGRWEALQGHPEKDVWNDEVAARLDGWGQATVPGSLVPGLGQAERQNLKVVWARKSFTVSRTQAGRSAALKWNSIRYGAVVWINGRPVAEHGVMGPHTVLLPRNLLREGKNQIVLKAAGWAGVTKSESGFPLIPTGSGTQTWGRKDPGIMDHIWIEFYDQVYLKWVLAMPDIAAGKVVFRVWFEASQPAPGGLRLTARVLEPAGGRMAGQTVRALDPNTSPAELPVPVRDARLWTPQTPHLYTAELLAESSGKILDAVRFRFGMRTIEVKDGQYRLNGRRLWLRGSNLVSEWLWSDRDNIFNNNIKTYIVDEARAMNLNCFRTHTLPPPAAWLNVSDEHGMMILAEFPVLYNYADFRFTPAEYEVFHKNVLLDAVGWVTKLWNRPSIIVWVISNENHTDHDWEMGPYRDHVRALDPTRPVLRSGEGTAESEDMHLCRNLERAEGEWVSMMMERARKRDPKRTLSNTEYMNFLIRRQDVSTRLLGAPDHPDERLVFAEFGMEHTEVMRRLDYDLILPYMYAGWTRLRGGNDWRADFPTPMAAALHSCMSPILASAELFDRNFTAGRQVTIPLVLINETPQDVRTTLDVYITPRDPLFVPDQAALDAALSHQSMDVTFNARSSRTVNVNWKAPEREGNYFLAVVTRIPDGKPVVSQRVVRSIDPAASAAGLKNSRIVALGAPGYVLDWLRQSRIPHITSMREGRIGGDVLVIGAAGEAARGGSARAVAIREFVRGGGKLVILAQNEWDWKDLLDFEVGKARASRAFIYPGEAGHPALRGIDPEFLKRWNGLPGEIAHRVIKGDILNHARKLLWIENPGQPVMASVTYGKGEIVVCMLDFERRLGRRDSAYDPVAERMLINLLQR